MKALPGKLDSAVDSPEPATNIAPVAGQVTNSVVMIVGATFVALMMRVVPGATLVWTVVCCTTCESGELVDAAFAPSPPYVATILCAPETRVLALHVAVFVLPLPASATAPQPVIVVPLSMNATLPVGPVPATVAVNVTFVPNNAGFAVLASVIVAGGAAVQLPATAPVPSTRNVAAAMHPATIVTCCGDTPPSTTGVIGFGA